NAQTRRRNAQNSSLSAFPDMCADGVATWNECAIGEGYATQAGPIAQTADYERSAAPKSETTTIRQHGPSLGGTAPRGIPKRQLALRSRDLRSAARPGRRSTDPRPSYTGAP